MMLRSSLLLTTFAVLAACAPAAPVEAPQPSAAQPATKSTVVILEQVMPLA